MADSDQEADLYAPRSEEERIAIRAELREWRRARQEQKLAVGKEGQKLFSQHHHAARQNAINTSIEFGRIFVRFSFALNGGAMIALLTLIGALHGRADPTRLTATLKFTDKLQTGMQFFIAGLSLAALTAGIAFLAWRFVAGTYLHEGQTSNSVSGSDMFGGTDKEAVLADFQRFDRLTDWSMRVSTAVAAMSLICFIIGALKVAKAFVFFSILR